MEDAAALRAELDGMRANLHNLLGASNFTLLRQASRETTLPVRLNGDVFRLPRDIILANRHCVQGMHQVVDGPLTITTEVEIMGYFPQRLPPGSVFVDVGAMGGIISLPMSRLHGGNVGVVAFEPSRSAADNFRRAVRESGVGNVEVVEQAVSDAPGMASFSEVALTDDTDEDWLTQTSTLTAGGAGSYEVQVTTLDRFFVGRPDRTRIAAIKIDVEGFEVHVIDGAAQLLSELKPALAIDIHADPFGEGMTDAKVQARLSAMGYACRKEGHVMFAEAG